MVRGGWKVDFTHSFACFNLSRWRGRVFSECSHGSFQCFNMSAARDFVIPGLGKFTNRIVLLNIFDRTNLIRPASGIGVFQAAYGPRITVYDALTVPLPPLWN